MSSSIEFEGGKKCKSYQRRSMKTGHCRNISGSRKMSSRSKTSRSRRRMVRGGEVVSEAVSAIKKDCEKITSLIKK
jgi:hypothetical protein